MWWQRKRKDDLSSLLPRPAVDQRAGPVSWDWESKPRPSTTAVHRRAGPIPSPDSIPEKAHPPWGQQSRRAEPILYKNQESGPCTLPRLHCRAGPQGASEGELDIRVWEQNWPCSMQLAALSELVRAVFTHVVTTKENRQAGQATTTRAQNQDWVGPPQHLPHLWNAGACEGTRLQIQNYRYSTIQ